MAPIVLLNNERGIANSNRAIRHGLNKLANILEDCRLLQNNRINGYPFRDPWSKSKSQKLLMDNDKSNSLF